MLIAFGCAAQEEHHWKKVSRAETWANIANKLYKLRMSSNNDREWRCRVSPED